MYFAHLELIKRSAVSRAWASSIHRAASFMLPACCRAKEAGKKTGKSKYSWYKRNLVTQLQSKLLTLRKSVYSVCVEFILNLVDLGLDEEELNECGRAVDGGVDVLQSEAGLVYEVKVLRQEILYPQQGGRGFLLPIICTHILHKSHWVCGFTATTSAFICDLDGLESQTN